MHVGSKIHKTITNAELRIPNYFIFGLVSNYGIYE